MHFLTLNAAIACLGEQMGLAMVLLAPGGPPPGGAFTRTPSFCASPEAAAAPRSAPGTEAATKQGSWQPSAAVPELSPLFPAAAG